MKQFICLFAVLFSFLVHNANGLEQITYQFSFEPIDAVIFCHEKDLETLDLCIDGIKKWGENINRIIVVSDRQLTDKAEWFDEKLFPFSKYDIALEIFDYDLKQACEFVHGPHARVGWIFKQIMCFYAPLIIPGISSNVLLLDADTIFLKPVTFQDEHGAALFNVGVECHEPYFEYGARLIPGFKKVFREYSGITHHMLFQRPVLLDLLEIVETTHNTEAWKAMCRALDKKHIYRSSMSEFEIYFNFAFLRSNQFKIRSLKFINTPRFDMATKLQNNKYDYISCHRYMRDDLRSCLTKKDSIVWICSPESSLEYLMEEIRSLRLLHETVALYVIAYKNTLQKKDYERLVHYNVSLIWYEDIPKSSIRMHYSKQSSSNYLLELFFCLEEFMSYLGLPSVYYVSSDSMKYTDLCRLLTESKNYQKYLMIYDGKPYPNFVYIKDKQKFSDLIYMFSMQSDLKMQIPLNRQIIYAQ